MSEDKFRLPGSSYDDLCKIIRSYGTFDKPFSLDDAAQVTGMHKTQVSRNNAFLGAVGIIEGDRTKETTTEGKRLARALDYDREDEVASIWQEIVWANEFLSKMIAAVKIRKGMDEATLKSHIAYSAGMQKSSETMVGAQAVINILQNAQLLMEKDDQLIPTESAFKDKDQNLPEVGTNIVAKQDDPYDKSSQLSSYSVHNIASSSNGVSVSIQIQVNVNPSDLENLGQKLKKLLDELASTSQGNT